LQVRLFFAREEGDTTMVEQNESWFKSNAMQISLLFCVTATVWFLGGLAFGLTIDDLKVALGILIAGLTGAGIRVAMGKQK
jgi:hypothetical protein